MSAATGSFDPEIVARRMNSNSIRRRQIRKNSKDTFTPTLNHKEKTEKYTKKALSFLAKALVFSGIAVVLKNSKTFNNLLKPVSNLLDSVASKFAKNKKVAKNAADTVQKSAITKKIKTFSTKVSGIFKKKA